MSEQATMPIEIADDHGVTLVQAPLEAAPAAAWRRKPTTDDKFLMNTRANARSFTRNGPKVPWLSRLGLRCITIPVDEQTVQGPVHRVTREKDFSLPYLHSRMFRLAEARARRGLRGRLSLTIVRHAQTHHNRGRRLSGAWFDADGGITREAREALVDLDLPVKPVLLHSPLTRARETAVALAESRPVAGVVVTEQGYEMNLGPFEGKLLDRLIHNDKNFQRLYVHGDALGSHPGAECLADLLVRAGHVIDEIERQASTCDEEDLDLVFVGHTMINRALRILAGQVYDEERGWYVCDGVDERFSLMGNGDALNIFEG